MITANGEVQTNEEAQVYVHDLDLFVTVQLLEETLAVLSLGKFCEDHGYSYEWVSSRKPRLTQEGRQLYAKRTISYLLLFPGYPPILVAIRLQHRRCTKLERVTSKPKTKTKRGMAIEIRTTVCEIFQECLHPHAFLMTQIRNVLRKWYQNQTNT